MERPTLDELRSPALLERHLDDVEVPRHDRLGEELEERGTPQLVKGGALHRREPEAVSSAQE